MLNVLRNIMFTGAGPKRAGFRPSKIAIAAASALMLAIPGAGAADVNLVFGTYAADKPTQTVSKLKPILDYLAVELTKVLQEEVTIEMHVSSDYGDSIQDLAVGDVDFARFGPASYVTAKKLNRDVKILAMETKKGKKVFHGVIAVREDSDIQDLGDLTGRSFAFGSELSTIGRYLAQSHLLDAGQTAETISRFSYLGRHDRVGAAVGNGTYDAGALKEGTLKKMLADNVPLRVIARFENVTKPWIARSGMRPDVLAAMQQIFLEIKDPAVLKSLKTSGFLPGSDSDYDVIRSAMLKSRNFGG